ncbi:uncharacterized protein G2W53_037436 [Senna tora]|uniref:Uncharacterized protein n=1 Tax=Senna tora TaxID=362788 RepID=A0A834W702_9FABA|nr:uncharacterized protein G2W53_037436 [Senna tora]
MGYHYIATTQSPTTTLVRPPPYHNTTGRLTDLHPSYHSMPHCSAHVTLYATQQHCAPLPITLYKLATPALHQHITVTLASSAPLYKPQLHKAQTGLYYPLCKGLTNWRPPWGIDFGTPYPTQVKRQKEKQRSRKHKHDGEEIKKNQLTERSRRKRAERKEKQVYKDQEGNRQEQVKKKLKHEKKRAERKEKQVRRDSLPSSCRCASSAVPRRSAASSARVRCLLAAIRLVRHLPQLRPPPYVHVSLAVRPRASCNQFPTSALALLCYFQPLFSLFCFSYLLQLLFSLFCFFLNLHLLPCSTCCNSVPSFVRRGLPPCSPSTPVRRATVLAVHKLKKQEIGKAKEEWRTTEPRHRGRTASNAVDTVGTDHASGNSVIPNSFFSEYSLCSVLSVS